MINNSLTSFSIRNGLTRPRLQRARTSLSAASYDKANHLIERPKNKNEYEREEYYELKHKHILKFGDDILMRWKQSEDKQYEKRLDQELKYYMTKLDQEYEEKHKELEKNFELKLQLETQRLENNYEKETKNLINQLAKDEEKRRDELIAKMRHDEKEALERLAKRDQAHLEFTIEQLKKQMRIEVYNETIQNKDKEVEQDLKRLYEEFALRELQAIAKTREECELEREVKIKEICKCYDESLEILMLKATNNEEKLKKEKILRETIEHDFRLLQTCFKRFINYTNKYNSDYMLKLRHIGQEIFMDEEYENELDSILNK